MKFNYDDAHQAWSVRKNQYPSTSSEDPWLINNSLDAYRHFRMRSPIRLLIRESITFLTVGDGRYGLDAQFIIESGGTAHASDLDSTLLEIASERGLIHTYSAENAEQLSFSDDSFDYVVIKEALHHFPRPYLALHEAFRVSRLGVILIEPTDPYPKALLRSFLSTLKNIFGNNDRFHAEFGFESVGNFVYALNIREFQKFLLGMGSRYLSTYQFNDIYLPGGENVPISSRKFPHLVFKIRFHGLLLLRNLLCRLSLLDWTMHCTLLFKQKPDQRILSALNSSGFDNQILPVNPYKS